MTIPQPNKMALKCKTTSLLVLLFTFQFISIFYSDAQQIPDTSYRFPMVQAAFGKGQGSVIVIDDAHHNSQFALNLIHWLDGVTAYQGVTTKEKIK